MMITSEISALFLLHVWFPPTGVNNIWLFRRKWYLHWVQLDPAFGAGLVAYFGAAVDQWVERVI